MDRQESYDNREGPPEERAWPQEDHYDGYQDDRVEGQRPYPGERDPGPRSRPPPPKKRSKGKIVVAIVIVIIMILAIVGIFFYFTRVVVFESEEVQYNTNAQGTLNTITVTGYLKNIGPSEVSAGDLKFTCDGEFLEDKFDESVSVSLVDDVTVIQKGESVEFQAELGGVNAQTQSTTATFKVVYKGIQNDDVGIDVGPYYG